MGAVLITQCLQNDFVAPLGAHDTLPNSLHIGYNEAKRLIGEKPKEGPIHTLMEWAYSLKKKELDIINIRDWHDNNDPSQVDHLRQFGEHCIASTDGAKFVFESVKNEREDYIINASGLNDFYQTNLQELLDSIYEEPFKVGLVGVWTEAKVYYLAYELITRYPKIQLAICSALTASSSRHMHFISLDQMQNILGAHVFSSVSSFTTFLTGTSPRIDKRLNSRLDTKKLKGDRVES